MNFVHADFYRKNGNKQYRRFMRMDNKNLMTLCAAACLAALSACDGGASAPSDSGSSANRTAQPSAPASEDSANAGSDFKAEVLLSDDFEKGVSEFSGRVGKGTAKISAVSGADALSGRQSLCLDSTGSSQEWILAAELGKNLKLEPGKAYTVEFKYRLADASNQSSNNYVSAAGKGGKFYARSIFAAAPGQSGSAKFAFVLPPDARDAALRFSSHGACRTIIDDLKVSRIDGIDADSWIFKPDAFVGMRKTPVNPNMLDLSNPSFSLPKEKYFPMIDEFGQFKHADWKGKPRNLGDIKAQIEEEKRYNASRPDIAGRDEFGGLAGSAGSAPKTEGFTTAKVGGKWYFRDPDGNLFWSIGVTGVGGFESTPITDREFYFEKIDPAYVVKGRGFKPGTDYYNREIKIYALGRRNAELKYGPDGVKNYWKIAAERFKKWGLNTYGAWSAYSVMASDTVPFTAYLSSAGAAPLKTKRKLYALWGNIPDYFAPAFETETAKRVKKSAKLLASRYCIGAFVDNEISWQRKPGVTALAVLSCPAGQPAKMEMQKMLREKYGSVENLNKAWKSPYSDWGDFLARDDFEPNPADADADLRAFEKLFAERYFKVCRAAVKAACPKALYMGCRFAAGENEIVSRAAYEICDVVSCNIYRSGVAFYAPPPGAKDKPAIIGEFHIGRIDKGSPYGGLLEVPDAQKAAEAYKKYMVSAIENPNIVGAHWFQWHDMFVTGRADGANATCGFVSVTDEPDYALADAIREVSAQLYKLRAQK